MRVRVSIVLYIFILVVHNHMCPVGYHLKYISYYVLQLKKNLKAIILLFFLMLFQYIFFLEKCDIHTHVYSSVTISFGSSLLVGGL